jgi:hypothetical protein
MKTNPNGKMLSTAEILRQINQRKAVKRAAWGAVVWILVLAAILLAHPSAGGGM